jgi:[phosphatase 2A protein]-leucine-carboxy methyltransferase
MASDEAIQLTNNDASNFKSYAVGRGYWNDPYINLFASKQQSQSAPVEHKPPEMSRGYFTRVKAIRNFVDKFIEKTNQNCQIVNLGAGYDTLYFNLFDNNKLPLKYVEIDFQRIVTAKIRLIKSKKILSEKIVDQINNEAAKKSEAKPVDGFALPTLPSPAQTANELHTLKYHIISCDLRNTIELDKKLKECNLDFTIPTLFIFECVLVYMTSTNSHNLLKYLNDNFKSLCLINYEQINLNDKFGEIMLSNMELRACKLSGVDVCKSIETQMNRFENAGFSKDLVRIRTMTDYYLNVMDQNERGRIEHIEFLDETELFFQLMDHYCVCQATNTGFLKNILF